MKFAWIATGVGLAGCLLASSLQGGATVTAEGLPATVVSDEVTGSIPAAVAEDARPAAGALRVIDLKSGASCKLAVPPAPAGLTAAPVGPDCAKSPSLARVALWRATDDGSLILADRGGETVVEFAPGDGVLYESVYPAEELITIVPARS